MPSNINIANGVYFSLKYSYRYFSHGPFITVTISKWYYYVTYCRIQIYSLNQFCMYKFFLFKAKLSNFLFAILIKDNNFFLI